MDNYKDDGDWELQNYVWYDSVYDTILLVGQVYHNVYKTFKSGNLVYLGEL